MSNRKGYALVEIILASLIAFGILFFIIYLAISVKNKNDDEFVETQVMTDRDIITNKIIEYAMAEMRDFDCDKLTKDENTVKYKDDVIDVVNEYSALGDIVCSNDKGVIDVTIPLSVVQMSDKDYDINVSYKYEIGDMSPPTCTLKVEGTNVKFASRDDNVGVAAWGLVKGGAVNYNNSESIAINNAGCYIGFVKDAAGNEGTCQIKVTEKSVVTSYKKEVYRCKNTTIVVCYHELFGNGTCYGGGVQDGCGVGGGNGCCYPPSYGANTYDACIEVNASIKDSQGRNYGYYPWTIGDIKYEFVFIGGDESVASCTPQYANMVCNKDNYKKEKILCTANGLKCSSGYTQVGNYCYKIVTEEFCSE